MKRKCLQKRFRRVIRAALRFVVQLMGTSLFVFTVVPLMAYNPGRTTMIAAAVICIGFALWLGEKIYGK